MIAENNIMRNKENNHNLQNTGEESIMRMIRKVQTIAENDITRNKENDHNLNKLNIDNIKMM